ncbi:kinase-like domain-containing protein [Biscogniauxia mediterranea]|nr:kinase-like domain-containing protein [Biscogniauxia mediterranea]
MSASKSTPEYITANQEVSRLPPGWKLKGVGKSNRVGFFHSQLAEDGTFEHPIFGPLPQDWELRKISSGQFVYYNTATQKSVNDGPRKIRWSSNPPPDSIIVRRAGMGKLKRREISKTPLHDKYTRVKVLDNGGGQLGGMNAGIYVVKDKANGQLYVEKSYNDTNHHINKLVKSEIQVMKKLFHSAIIHYIASYIQDDPFQATVYMEYCDRGSLKDLLAVYKRKKKAHEPDLIPESFLWHAFVGLSDALGFLRTGQSHISVPLEKNDPKAWVPIIHRDIKPDNVFLRSRDTPGSTKPFYVLLSDFGLATYESAPTASRPGLHSLCGSVEYHAPELAFDPYPPDSRHMELQAGPHTSKSDVWAVACMVYCLCERDQFAHLDRKCFPLRSRKAVGRAAKRPTLDIAERGFYSDYLARCIQWAGERDPQLRPDGWELVCEMKIQRDLWMQDANWKAQVDEGGRLPWWATTQQGISVPS